MYKYWRLCVISFLILFIELLVVRLVSTEIRIFAYFSNLVLLATFVGSGLGMLVKKKLPLSISIGSLFLISAALVVKYIVRLPNVEFNFLSGITEMLSPLSEAYIWLQLNTYSLSGIFIGLILTILLFLLLVVSFLPLGQFLGNELNNTSHPILIYSLNLIASLVGMWAFQLFSLSGLSPYFGLFLGQLLLLTFVQDQISKMFSAMFITATLVLLLPKSAHQPYEAPTTFWSPYQKIILSLMQGLKPHQPGGWFLEVNNVYHMALLDLSPKTISEKEPFINEFLGDAFKNLEFLDQYSLPYRFAPSIENVLIIGGGGGNDIAAAIRAGAKHIDAVEIDPTIVAIGKQYHPEKPYSNPIVQAHIDDGRSFLETTSKKYDLIIMGLVDSHTVGSSLTNLRLDNYLYTLESFQKSKSRLADNGVFVISFAVGRPWIGARIDQTLAQAFQQTPLIFEVKNEEIFGYGGTFFIVSKNPEAIKNILRRNQKFDQFINQNKKQFDSPTKLLTDDWPYLYLDKPRLPLLNLLVAILVISLLVLLSKKTIGNTAFGWDFFFLGIGFMLFEFQNISKSSLIFGNTWTTNLLVITGVLCFSLLANIVVYRKMINEKQAFLLLFFSLVFQFLLPTSFFNRFSGLTKLSISMVFLNLPHFFSGALFVILFTKAVNKASSFGSNLLGSAVGGFLEMLSFLFGVSSLIYIVIASYTLGWLTRGKAVK